MAIIAASAASRNLKRPFIILLDRSSTRGTGFGTSSYRRSAGRISFVICCAPLQREFVSRRHTATTVIGFGTDVENGAAPWAGAALLGGGVDVEGLCFVVK